MKTRRFDAIMAEIEGFFAACRGERVWPGGIHLEFTGEDVTECLGGSEAVLEDQLSSRYMTLATRAGTRASPSATPPSGLAELMRQPYTGGALRAARDRHRADRVSVGLAAKREGAEHGGRLGRGRRVARRWR